MSTIIYGGTIVNEGRSFLGSLVIDNDRITEIYEDSSTPRGLYSEEIDATGCLVMPGVIDEHVHMREPGLTQKADWFSCLCAEKNSDGMRPRPWSMYFHG